MRTILSKGWLLKWYQNKQGTKDIILSSELNFLSEFKQLKRAMRTSSHKGA